MLVLIFIFSLNFSYATTWEQVDGFRPNIDIGEDDYIYFDAPEGHQKDEEFGIELEVDEDSRSAQWINLYFSIEQEILDDGKADAFLILANGKIVDVVYRQYTRNKEDELLDRLWYEVKPSIPELTGTNVFFQIIAVQEHHTKGIKNYYAVAWSNVSDTVKMDDLPVKDNEAISVLTAIYEKLHDKLSETNSLLNKLNKEVETMFTPSEQAKEKLDEAMKELKEKLPTEELKLEMEQMKNTFESSKDSLTKEGSKLTFGEKADYLQIGVEFYLLDLTELKDMVFIFRNSLRMVIWVEFFTMIIFFLLPRLKL